MNKSFLLLLGSLFASVVLSVDISNNEHMVVEARNKAGGGIGAMPPSRDSSPKPVSITQLPLATVSPVVKPTETNLER